MQAELLYVPGCPNRGPARRRLGAALKRTGYAGAAIAEIEVETEQQAADLCFPGSPTIRVEGRDLFPVPGPPYGLSCRVYTTPEGVDGAPSLDRLVRALKSRTGWTTGP